MANINIRINEDLKKQADVAAILGQFPGATIDKVKPLTPSTEEEEKDSEESA